MQSQKNLRHQYISNSIRVGGGSSRNRSRTCTRVLQKVRGKYLYLLSLWTNLVFITAACLSINSLHPRRTGTVICIKQRYDSSLKICIGNYFPLRRCAPVMALTRIFSVFVIKKALGAKSDTVSWMMDDLHLNARNTPCVRLMRVKSGELS